MNANMLCQKQNNNIKIWTSGSLLFGEGKISQQQKVI